MINAPRIGDRVTRDGALGTVEHVSSAAPYAVVCWDDINGGWDRDLCPLADLTPTGKRGNPAWTGTMVTLDSAGVRYNNRSPMTREPKADPDEFQRVEEVSPAAPAKRRAGRRERVVEAPAVETDEAFESTEVPTPEVVANQPHAPSGSSIDVGRTNLERDPSERSESLALANAVRLIRGKLRHRWRSMPRHEAFLEAADLVMRPDEWARTWHVELVLQAIPWMGEQRTVDALRTLQISPRKTLWGLSPRQRDQLVTWLSVMSVLAAPTVMRAEDIQPAEGVAA